MTARRPADRPRRVLVGLELGTGVAATAGGLLLAAAPDGSLLRADPAALRNSPFGDYRRPGILLATLVGGGLLVAGAAQALSAPGARAVSAAAGIGLVLFEAAELRWLGFQPLEAVFAGVGAAVAGLALCAPAEPAARRSARSSRTSAGSMTRQ